MQYKLRMTYQQYAVIYSHVSKGDDFGAILICGQSKRKRSHCFMGQKVIFLDKKTNYEQLEAQILNLTGFDTSIVLFKVDSNSFNFLKEIPIIIAKFDSQDNIIAYIESDKMNIDINMVNVVGDDILINYIDDIRTAVPECADRHSQCFGPGTTNMLRKISIGVVGVSGTGCFVVELLARLGVGEIVLIDFDKVAECNLNRIINSKRTDIDKYKTEVAARAINEMDMGTDVVIISENLASRKAVKAISNCDIVFGCVDSSEGRYLLNRIASFYVIPYFDVGIRLDADGKGGINQICGSVNYIKPGGSSIVSRGSVLMEDVEAEGLKRTNPEEYEQQLQEKYVKGVFLSAPAVISLNSFYASMAVNDFLARIHSFRDDGNTNHGGCMFSVTQEVLYQLPRKGTEKTCEIFLPYVGKGDIEPLLARSELSE